MDADTNAPDEVLEAVEQATREQAAIDDYDEPAATKVERRDVARSALEDELGIEEDPGPNPS
jgi:hypothetical protein